jgi:hypothetical protein
MPSGKPILLLAVGAVVVGCAPPVERVFVDVDRVLAEWQIPAPVDPTVPSRPASPGTIVELHPGLPPRTVRVESQFEPEALRARFAARQEQTYRDLLVRLRRVYAEEARRVEVEGRRTLQRFAAERFDEAADEIRRVFELAAEERAPVIARLSLLVGFPDPNPANAPPALPMLPVQQRRFEEAQALRTRLDEIDAKYEAMVAQVLAGIDDLVAEQAVQVQIQLEKFRAAADQRAQREAAAQIREVVQDLRLDLSDSVPVAVPGVPERRVAVTAEPVGPPPQVRSRGIFDRREDRERLVRADLRIWSAVNRYGIVERPQQGRDATQEFQAWRETYQAGP